MFQSGNQVHGSLVHGEENMDAKPVKLIGKLDLFVLDKTGAK